MIDTGGPFLWTERGVIPCIRLVSAPHVLYRAIYLSTPRLQAGTVIAAACRCAFKSTANEVDPDQADNFITPPER
jgi:hypothetical protein